MWNKFDGNDSIVIYNTKQETLFQYVELSFSN